MTYTPLGGGSGAGTAIASIGTPAANTVPVFTSGTTASTAAATTAGLTILGDATASDQRTSLGLNSAATMPSSAFDVSGAAAAAQAASLQKSQNLSDVASASTSRTNLGLGGAAVLNVGTVASTVAAGDDSRMTNARTPTAHAATHASAGSDPVTLAESQVTNLTTDLAAKAPLASPALTGVPTAPTAAGGTSTTQLATTAFVQSAVGTPAVLRTPTADVTLAADYSLIVLRRYALSAGQKLSLASNSVLRIEV